MRSQLGKIVLYISLIFITAACSNMLVPPTQVLVITSAPIVITATELPPLSSPTQLPPLIISTPAPSIDNLDRYPQEWKVFTEGAPVAEIKGVTSPSLDGESLHCSNKGGEPYSNIHCYLNLPPESDVSTFILSLAFLFTPTTTCNNQDGRISIVQALEFSMSNWTNEQRYEFALQWQNVGNGAPQWRYWDPHQAEGRRWRPVDSKVTQCLESDKWHTLQLEGSTNGIEVHYEKFTIDNQTFDLNFSTARVKTPGEVARLAIAIQLDGNANQTPYDVFIDKVSFTRQGAASLEPMPADCSQAKINEFPATNGYIDRDTVISWTPSSCIMNIQIYQDGKLLRENKAGDASGSVNLSGIPTEAVEIKIWVPTAGNPSDSKAIQIQ